MEKMSKKKMATVGSMAAPAATCRFSTWTSACSPWPEAADLVYSPLVDAKNFPEDVDVTLVEGAVSSEEDLHKIKMVRERTKILVSLGDCAVTANVPGMRNPFGTKAVYDRAYRENVTFDPGIPDQVVPALLPDVASGARVRQGGCVCSGLPALGRHHLLRRHGIAGRPAPGLLESSSWRNAAVR